MDARAVTALLTRADALARESNNALALATVSGLSCFFSADSASQIGASIATDELEQLRALSGGMALAVY